MTTIQRKSLDVSAPETFERWCTTPDYDTRTLEEFAADGGYPTPPPNLVIHDSWFGPAWNRQPLPPVYQDDEDS